MRSLAHRTPRLISPDLLTLVVSAVSFVSVAGCWSGPAIVSPLHQRLAGRGPIVLDQSNPDLPAQAFFVEQQRGSPELTRFMKEHGNPTAISLERKLYRRTRINLYYPQYESVFLFTRGMRDWVEENRQPISAQDLQRISSQLQESGQTLPAPISDAARDVQPQSTRRANHVLSGHLKPPSSAGEAMLTRLPDGDYRHEVTFPGESLSLLADWYCDDPEQASALARASGLAVGAPLSRGDAITVPKRLMRNAHALPEAALP